MGAINHSGTGHTLDFSSLPSNFSVDFYPDMDRVLISDGTSNFTIGDGGFGGAADATSGGTTQPNYFTNVVGSDGADVIDASGGNDTLSGGGGDDFLSGHAGNDNLRGGEGSDQLVGGDDSLFGNEGDDTLVGGAGDDLLQGEEGNDSIVGGAGDDTVNISDFAENDSIDGGESAGDSDALIFVSATPVSLNFTTLENGSYAYSCGGGASGTFTNVEHFEGGAGRDTLDFSALDSAITVTFTGDTSGTISNSTGTITFGNVESMFLSEGADVVDATATHSGVFGDAPGVDIEGRGGDDTLLGGRGGDTIDGGIGADQISGDYGDDFLSGGSGADSLVGGDGNDSIIGGEGADTILGGDEADSLYGGSGNDDIQADEGADLIFADAILLDLSEHVSGPSDSTTNLTVVNSAGGPIELWWVNWSGLPEQYATIEAGAAHVQFTFEEHNWVLRDTDGNFLKLNEGAPTQTVNYGVEGLGDVIDGGTDNDTIFGQFGNDTIEGGAGNDSIEAGVGDDSILGGDGNDTLIGAAGNDSLQGADGNDFIEGGTGNDTLSGGEGTDTLLGGDGGDSVYGDAGEDTLQTSTGADRLDGGGDADTFLANSDMGQ